MRLFYLGHSLPGRLSTLPVRIFTTVSEHLPYGCVLSKLTLRIGSEVKIPLCAIFEINSLLVEPEHLQAIVR